MRHGEEMLLDFAEGTPDPARDVPGRRSTGGGGRRCTCSARPRSPTTSCCAGTSSPSATRTSATASCRSTPRCSPGTASPRPIPTCATTPTPGGGSIGRDRLGAAAGHARQPRPRQRPPHRRRGPALVGHRLGARRAGGGRRMIRRSVLHDRPDRADADGQNGVWRALQDVDDPEYPGVSIVELGLVEDVWSTRRRGRGRSRPDVLRLPGAVADRVRRAGRQSVRSTASATSTCASSPRRCGRPSASRRRARERDRRRLRRRRRTRRPRRRVPALRCRGARRAVAVRAGALPVGAPLPAAARSSRRSR